MTEQLCAADTACRNVNPTTKKRAIGIAEWHRLCSACLGAGVRTVRALPADWVDLEQLLPPALGVWRDGQPGRGEPAAPVRLGVDALQRAIWWCATAWEDIMRDVERLAPVPSRNVRHGVAVARAVRILTSRVGKLADLPVMLMADYPTGEFGHDAEDIPELYGLTRFRGIELSHVDGVRAVLDLTKLHGRAQAMLGLTSPIRQLPGECSGCGKDRTLRQKQPQKRGDDPPVYCDACDRRWSYDEYARYAGLLERAA